MSKEPNTPKPAGTTSLATTLPEDSTGIPVPTVEHHAYFSKRLRQRHREGRFFEWVCWLATWGSLATLLVLLLAMASEAWGWLSWSFLTSYPSRHATQAGLLAGLWGSFWLILLTAIFSMPIGIGAAVYLEEYATRNWFTKFIQLNISNLAGVPSIVYGILGFTVFVRMFGMAQAEYELSLGFIDVVVPIPFGRSVIAGALTLTLLSLPVVIIASQEALRAVPASLRHASLALGASRWQTIWHQVLPAALPGIMTGAILSMSRAIGETAPLVALGAASYVSYTPGRIESPTEIVTSPGKLAQIPFDNFTAIPLQIYTWVNEAGEDFQHVAAAGIVVLLMLLLVMNGLAILIRHHFQKKIRW